MGLDGIWAVEIVGFVGWDRTSIAFLEKGIIRGSGAKYFYHGSYVADEQNVKMTIHLTSHDKKANAFGEKRKKFTVILKGVSSENEVQGHVKLKGARSDDTTYRCRLLRLEDLPD